MSREEPPEDWRNREVDSDDKLLAQEKEFRLVSPGDVKYCYVSTEIPTYIKWIQSVEESDVEWVRTDESGSIVALAARIPRGMLMLKGSSRKSDTPSQSVSYGPHYD